MSGKCALWPLRFLTTVILLESPHSRAFASWTQTSFLPLQSSWGPRVSTEHLGRKATGDRKAVSVSPGFSVSSPEVWGWGACLRSLWITGGREPLYLLRQEGSAFWLVPSSNPTDISFPRWRINDSPTPISSDVLGLLVWGMSLLFSDNKADKGPDSFPLVLD